MSGSDRSGYVAAFVAGIVILGLSFGILAYAFQLGDMSGRQEAEANGYAAEYPESTAKRIDVCFKNRELSDRQDCIEKAIESGRENQRSEYDLNAQRNMAEWAFWLLVITGFGLIVTIVGTIGLYMQISLTRKAVEDTGLATQAMQRQNDIAERSDRPWVQLKTLGHKQMSIEFNLIEISVDVEAFNHGNSPARDLWVDGHIILAKAISDDILPLIDEIEKREGHPKTVVFPKEQGKRQVIARHKGDLPASSNIILVLCCRYQGDDPSQQFTTAFALDVGSASSATTLYGIDGWAFKLYRNSTVTERIKISLGNRNDVAPLTT